MVCWTLGQNPDGPTLRDDSHFVDPGHRTSFASPIPVLNLDGSIQAFSIRNGLLALTTEVIMHFPYDWYLN